MPELSTNHGLDTSREDTPLFGADVDIAPGEVMPLGVMADATDELYVKPRRKGRVTFWIAAGWIGLVVFLAVFADFLPFVHSYSAGASSTASSPRRSTIGSAPTSSATTSSAGRSTGPGCRSRSESPPRSSVSLRRGVRAHRRVSPQSTDTFIVTIIDIMLAFPALVLALMLVTFGRRLTAATATSRSARSTTPSPDLAGHPRPGRPVDPAADPHRAGQHAASTRSASSSWRPEPRSQEQPRPVPGDPAEHRPADALVRPHRLAILIVAEGALAFLGLSVPPPTPTWGKLIEGKNPCSGAWWISLLPAPLMFLTILAFNMMGDVAGQALRHPGLGRVKKGQLSKSIAGHRTVSGPLLEVEDLKTHFHTDLGHGAGRRRRVASPSTAARRSASSASPGSGKTILSRSIMGLLPKRNVVREAGSCSRARTSATFRLPAMRGDLGHRDGDDLPGPDDVAQPGDEDRPADHRVAQLPPRACRSRTRRPPPNAPARRRHPRARPPARGVPAPALRRHAPARHDRHRPRLRAHAAVRRRAHHGARRHRAGADPRPAGRSSSRPQHVDDPRHPRPRRRRRAAPTRSP